MANSRTNSPAFSQSAKRGTTPLTKAPAEEGLPKLPSASKMMDLRPSQGLAAGLKRVGGRSGISRLTGRKHPGSAARTILKKYT